MPLAHVLVTGGAGFIGHHIARALIGRGVRVTVLDDLSVGKRDNIPPAARFVQGDVRDPAAVREALEGVDAVLHEAAIVSVRASIEHFVRDADVNLMGTLNLLQQMAGRPIQRAVLASSMAVYADSATPTPLTERACTEPIAPYGAAKLAAERYWLMMGAQTGIPSTALRYFNTYGPNQTFTPYVGVITIFVQRLLRGQMPVIFGDGEQRRDFIHVDDIVAANLAVLDAPADSVSGQTFNVGTGQPTSVNQIAAGLIAILAPGAQAEYGPVHGGEMRNAIADVSAIQNAVGWAPRRRTVSFADVVEFWRRSSGSGSGQR